MIFLASLGFLGWANVIVALRNLKADGRLAWPTTVHLLAVLAFLGAGLYGILVPAIGMPEGLSQPNWAVWAFFALGLLTLLAFGQRLVRAARGQAPQQGLGFGISVLALMAGIYMMAVAVDHWWFFSSKEAGVGSAVGLGVDDVACDRFLLIRVESDDALYRCPTFAVYGSYIVQPFAPWPDYDEGRSVELKTAIDALKANALSAGADR